MPCYPGLWQISFPGRKLSKTDGMNTVSPQSDHHSLSCIAMQRAENDSDAFFRFFRGKISLFAVFASESRSARFGGAYNAGIMVNVRFYIYVFLRTKQIWMYSIKLLDQ